VPLLAINGIDFYSLQVGQQAASFNPEKTPLIDLSQHLKDFADTAGVLAQLDLVISVDSSVAHLAGALGKPVWTLLSLSAEWRWAGATGQSPLYPDMQLFWQPEFGDWTTVIDQVCDALKAKLKP
jgi:ADP-heptose:LPS heptosyltransferase